MNVTRDVILDLLPVYLSGESSPDTRLIIEEYMKGDEDLARRIRGQWIESLAKAAPTSLPPELELRTLRRTRRLLGWQRWLFGFGIAFLSLAFAMDIRFGEDGIEEFHFVIQKYPGQLGIFLGLGLACWIAYFALRRRLRTTSP